MKQALTGVRKMYLADAISVLSASHKKVSKWMVKTMFNLMAHARARGMEPYRLYIHGIIMGKTRRFKGLRYHAKSRMGRETTDLCQARVIVYEKPEEEFFNELVEGKVPASLRSEIKNTATDDYQTIQKFKYLLTSKGTQQMRLLIKRRVQLMMKENEEKGVFVPKKVLMKQVEAEHAERLRKGFQDLKKKNSTLEARQEVYKKNNEAK